MARKKRQTYNEVVRSIAEMQALLVTQKRHMVEVLAGAMDDKTAAMLGDFNDAELRQVARMMFAHAGDCAARVKAERRARDQARQTGAGPAARPEAPVKYAPADFSDEAQARFAAANFR